MMSVRSLVLVTLLTAAGCPVTAPQPSEFEVNRARWEAAGLESYEFDYQLGCECTDESRRPVHIVVQAGSVIEARHLEDGTPADLALFGDITVENQFARIEKALLTGTQTVVVMYDPELGYPTDTYIHYVPAIADLEAFFSITNLTPR